MLKRPIIRTFNWCVDHPETGLSGWQLPGWEDLIPSMDFGVAHDACEHFDLTLGLDAECLALGAIYYGRVAGGFWNRSMTRQDPADILGHEFVVDFVNGEGGKWPTQITSRRWQLDDDAESALTELEAHIVKYAMEGQNGDDPLPELQARAEAENMLRWVRRGYRRAQRRWDQHGGPFAFLDMFDAVTQGVKAIGEPEDENDKLIVRLWGEGNADVRVKEYVDPYMDRE